METTLEIITKFEELNKQIWAQVGEKKDDPIRIYSDFQWNECTDEHELKRRNAHNYEMRFVTYWSDKWEKGTLLQGDYSEDWTWGDKFSCAIFTIFQVEQSGDDDTIGADYVLFLNKNQRNKIPSKYKHIDS